MLLQAGIDVQEKDDHGKTAMDLAMDKKHFALQALLVHKPIPMTSSLEHTKVFAGEIRMSASNHSGESFRFQAEVDLAHESAARLIREAIHRLIIERERSLIHDIKSPFSPHHAPGGVPLLRQRSQ